MANALKYHYTPEEVVEKLFAAGIFDPNNRGFLQRLVDNIIIKENQFFWQECFRLDGTEHKIDITDHKKNPAWTVVQRDRRTIPMADAMAPLSEPMQLDVEGGEEKTGSIYQYGKGLYQTSMSKLEYEAKLKELGVLGDAALGYARGVADLIKSHNLTISNMAAQTLSRGGAYGNTINLGTAGSPKTTQGFSGVTTSQSSYIPSANFTHAITKAWSDADADIPDQMRQIEATFKEANNIPDSTPFQWDIPWNTVVNVLLNNAKFKAEVNRYIRLYAPDKVVVITNGTAGTDVDTITWEQLVAYSNSPISKVAPIHVVREQQVVQGITTYHTVSGWNPDVVVLRPLGYAGVLVHAQVPEVELLRSGEVNNTVSFGIAQAQRFLYVINKVVPNGMLKSYHTDVIGRYATVLDEAQYHVVVDITATS